MVVLWVSGPPERPPRVWRRRATYPQRVGRYADDCNIYVRSQAAGERVIASVTLFLENRLRLNVNRQKSVVAPIGEREFLGHRLGKGGALGIGRKSLARAKDRLREITRRNRGDCSMEQMIEQTNRFSTGWVTYYRHAQSTSTLRDLDRWLRRSCAASSSGAASASARSSTS
jgi:RNA-directed DNA polymerase